MLSGYSVVVEYQAWVTLECDPGQSHAKSLRPSRADLSQRTENRCWTKSHTGRQNVEEAWVAQEKEQGGCHRLPGRNPSRRRPELIHPGPAQGRLPSRLALLRPSHQGRGFPLAPSLLGTCLDNFSSGRAGGEPGRLWLGPPGSLVGRLTARSDCSVGLLCLGLPR